MKILITSLLIVCAASIAAQDTPPADSSGYTDAEKLELVQKYLNR